MEKKIGRNDPCPCGSGKKYKQCCMSKAKEPRKIKATVISSGPQKKAPDLMQRTFGNAIEAAEKSAKPPVPKKDESA